MAKDTVEGIYGRLLATLNSRNAFQNTDALSSAVERALSDASSNTTTSSENRRMKWEYLIKRDVFQHAMLEGKALASSNKEDADNYYKNLQDWLDLALVFTELGATEASYTFSVVQDLLETQTIPSCMKIFDWIERRSRDRTLRTIGSATATTTAPPADLGSGRLTAGLQPQKGKALILLRMLNDLLRRLSKAGGETIGFSGRILTYLSQVFPLGERSGVNLRGEYGPTWEMPTKEAKEITENADKDKDDFYSTFWSLQLPFSKPSVFATPNSPMTFAQFQDAVDKVLPVIKEATAKERAMMGAGRSAGTMSPATLKRKRGHDEEMITEKPNGKPAEYFFAKFLTSPELLDLELADTHFRRQILFQLLIVLDHLLTHTKAEKAKWVTNKNRSLYIATQEWCLDDALNYGGTVETNTAPGAGAGTTTTTQTTTSSSSEVKGTRSNTAASTSDVTTTSSATAPGASKDRRTGKDEKGTPTKPSNSKPSSSSAPTAPAASTLSASTPSFLPNHSTSTISSSSLVERPERIDPIKWTHLTISRTLEELRQTQPPSLSSSTTLSSSKGASSAGGVTGVTAINGLTGREFASTVQSLLEREKGWIRWKNELCDGKVFERGVWEPSDELTHSLVAMEYTEKDEASMKMKLDGDHQDDEGKGRCKKPKTMYEATRGFRTRMRGPFYIAEENQKEWQWDLGTEALSEIWAMGYRGLEDLEKGFSPGTPHEFLRQLELEDRRIEIRTKTLRAQQERRLQMERAAREKIEKADREAKEKEVRAIKETGDVEMNDAKDAESTKVLKKEDADVEMKPPETNSALTMKTEVSPQPIPIHVSDQTSRASTPSRTSIHPSLPPKPGSRAVSPVKAATPVPSIPTLTTSPSSALTAAPSAAIPIATKTTVAATPTPAPTLPALPQDEQIRKAEESKTRITWLALRTTRDSAQGYLVHFNKIGAGDLKMLCEEIDKAEREKEEKEKAEKEGKDGSMDVDQLDTGKDTEIDGKVGNEEEEKLDPPGSGLVGSRVETGKVDTEGDVKME